MLPLLPLSPGRVSRGLEFYDYSEPPPPPPPPSFHHRRVIVWFAYCSLPLEGFWRALSTRWEAAFATTTIPSLQRMRRGRRQHRCAAPRRAPRHFRGSRGARPRLCFCLYRFVDNLAVVSAASVVLNARALQRRQPRMWRIVFLLAAVPMCEFGQRLD